MNIRMLINNSLKPILICFLLAGLIQGLKAQVTIGGGGIPDKSAVLDIMNTDKGLLIPQINLKGATDMTSIPDPSHSLIVYNLNNGDNNTDTDTSDDVYADNLYIFENGKWNLLYKESDLERSLTSFYLPRIVSIVSMKKTGNESSFVGKDIGGEVRKYLFDNIIRDDGNNFNTTTGEFVAPNTGVYRIEINILLRPLRVVSGSLCLGISKPYIGDMAEGNYVEKFYSYTNILNPAVSLAHPAYLGFKIFIHLKEGEKITPLVRYITPERFSLNVERINYDRVATNTMSIVFYPMPS